MAWLTIRIVGDERFIAALPGVPDLPGPDAAMAGIDGEGAERVSATH
jgi:hypothetical protein